ncbi:hypothetical protein ASPZODRAFT_136113 [Penicilliopsis zonata CBS 506.65]|uniref:Zn(2)-C6 fungal-type domain-containing protein n=1 Tax=Penicilliopsis zonata CBS 506.65 TaxID=1073090 RepID=A0A1L9S922_9EURO|nr:hypothetical protein ASPZODRAFT_136113 [Penicilliopsis zonata CBS 506.65]OJJ43661.1 hypothetical protein ASPZODRAFT_136113 [Penicilliopsis zonata CBS 506.65]
MEDDFELFGAHQGQHQTYQGQGDREKSPPKRRRPPLSCTECRRRKLKCDRLLPCSQCVRSKTADSCIYTGLQPEMRAQRQPSSEIAAHQDNTSPLAISSNAISVPRPPGGLPSANTTTTAITTVAAAQNSSPSQAGVFVFDSKLKNPAHRITKAPRPPDEVHELRRRVQTLEHALARAANVPTPEHSGYDGVSEMGLRSVPLHQDQILDDHVENLADACFRGKMRKTRYFGRCHWTLSVSIFQDIRKFLKETRQNEAHRSEFKSMKRFKSEVWGKEKRDHQRVLQSTSFRLEDLLPSRAVADELVNLYLTTFEMTHRILHVPTFLEQYNAFWAAATRPPDNTVFEAMLLAIFAASSSFLDPNLKVLGDEPAPKVASRWILAVQSWLPSTNVSSWIDIRWLQVQCIVVIARQATACDGDIVWVHSGALLRSAMMMGLHRDPYRFPSMTRFWAEMRRRLWTTLVELEIQSSLDSGVAPAIDPEEYDCGLPSDIDDYDLMDDKSDDPLPRQTTDSFTRSTFQKVMLRSLTFRLRVSKLVNSLKFSLSYDEALRLSEGLEQHLRDASIAFAPSSRAASPDMDLAAFPRSMYVFLLRRHLLALHRPFSLSIVRSPKFAYSRKQCLEGSLEMLTLLEPVGNNSPSSSTSANKPTGLSFSLIPRIAQLSGGMFRDEFFHAAITVCVELSLQADEYAASALTSMSSGPAAMTSLVSPLSDMVQSQQDVLIRVVEHALDAFGQRLGPAAKGGKCYLFLNLVLASVRARLKGEDSLKWVEEASKRTIQNCKELLSGVPWGEGHRTQPLESSGGGIQSTVPVPQFDPLLSTDIPGISPFDFDNLFDMSEYGLPEMWESSDFLPPFPIDPPAMHV